MKADQFTEPTVAGLQANFTHAENSTELEASLIRLLMKVAA